MRTTRIWHLLLAVAAVGAIWVISTPAQAQLVAGCACPAGFDPLSGTTCMKGPVTAPAICPFNNIAHIAAAQQQQSFWGIQTILQQRRDQIQATPVPGAAGSRISGYSASSLDEGTGVLEYSSQSQKTNPLASPLYDAAPSSAAPNPVWGAWVQGLGNWEHDSPLSAADIGHVNTTYTAQGGIDRTQQGVISANDALVLGIVSSWTSTHVSYDNTPTTMDLVGPGVGVYSEYVRGGFSTDLTAKLDSLQLGQNFAGAAPNVSIGVTNAGVSGNAQYKFKGTDNIFLEPTMGFTLTHTGFASGAAALGLQDAYTVRLQAGARLGTTWDAGNNVSVDASLKALVYGDAISQGTSINAAATPFASSITPSDDGLVRGELDPQLCFNLADGYSVSLSGQFQFGEAIVAAAAGLNLRKQW